MFNFGRKKPVNDEEQLTEEERRKRRKKTLRNVKKVRMGDFKKRKALMDEITDTDQYMPRK
jgi:hypothetical protein